jgi:hypothetical protein
MVERRTFTTKVFQGNMGGSPDQGETRTGPMVQKRDKQRFILIRQ